MHYHYMYVYGDMAARMIGYTRVNPMAVNYILA